MFPRFRSAWAAAKKCAENDLLIVEQKGQQEKRTLVTERQTA
jgi:hypothetical protein